MKEAGRKPKVWNVELFGTLCVERGHRRITRFRTRKTGMLLACLACEPQRGYRRDELIERLWPGYDIDSGRNCLRIALSSLRMQMEPDPQDEGRVLIADRTEVSLNPESYVTDKSAFETNLKAAMRSEDDAVRIEMLQKAIEQYRADLLPDFDDMWITEERQRLGDAYQMALRRLIKEFVTAKRYEEALPFAHRAVQAAPHREESHRVLMQLYALMGRPSAAVRQYRELQSLLRQSSGGAPSTITQDLLSRVEKGSDLMQETAAPLYTTSLLITPPPLSRPTVVPPAYPLPAPLTRLFGLEESIAQVQEMLATPETRLVTLTGLGGSGKTRLALAVGEQMQPAFAGRVCFVPLAQLASPQNILQAVASALHLRLPFTFKPLEKQVQEALSAQPHLLILDNCEHLLPEAAQILHRLLETIPTLTCLTTSRQRLNLPGEYEFAVRPLITPYYDQGVERLETYASIQLWTDRARMVSPEFQLTVYNSDAVTSLCRALEGVPLAMELAASWMGTLTPQQILTRLNRRFDILISRQATVSGRHASLRAALDWSYNLLSPASKRFFACLSLFRGGWTLEAAEAVCDEPLALDYLTQLRERSLVTARETQGTLRFSFLETVREYAQEHLTAIDRAAGVPRYQNYFLQVAEIAESHLKGAEQAVWLDRLEQERENMREALQFGQKEAPNTEGCLRMASALWRFWHLHGDAEEGSRWLSEALAHSAGVAASWRLKALNASGHLAFSQGDYAQAHACYTRSRKLHAAQKDTRGEASAVCNLGNVAHRQGKLSQARDLLTQSHAMFVELKDERGMAMSLGNLASLAIGAGDFPEALSASSQCIEVFRRLGDTQNIVLALNNAGDLALRMQDFQQVRRLLDESLALGLELGNKRSIAQSLSGVATLAQMQEAFTLSGQLMGAAANLREQLHIQLPASAQADWDKSRDALQAVLDETTFSISLAQGKALTLAEAVQSARNYLADLVLD